MQKYVPGKNIFCSMNKEKNKEENFLKSFLVLLRSEMNAPLNPAKGAKGPVLVSVAAPLQAVLI